MRSPSQTRGSEVPSEYIYPLLQQKTSFPSYFPKPITWKRKNWIKVWRGKCFNMCFYMKNVLGGTLWLFSQLAGPLPSCWQRWDRPNLCMCSCTSWVPPSSVLLQQTSSDSTSSAAAQCNCLLPSHLFLQVNKSISSCPHPCRDVHALPFIWLSA